MSQPMPTPAARKHGEGRAALTDAPVLPHNLEAERALLGAILIDNGGFVRCAAQVDSRDFYRDAHRRLYSAMAALDERGQVIDLVTLRDELSRSGDLDDIGGPVYVASLVDGVPRSINVEHYATIIRRDSATRRAMLAATAWLSHVREDPTALTNGATRRLLDEIDAATVRASQTMTRASESLPELAARLAGCGGRDTLIGDLVALGEIAMLHGQPRVDKTWIVCDLSLSLATGTRACRLDRLAVTEARRVLLVSNEDGAARYLERLRLLAAGRGLDTLPDTIYLLVHRGVSLDDATWQHRLIDEIRREAIALLILDPFRSVTAAADQGPAELQPVARYLRRLLGETGAAVLMVHHDTKPQPGISDTRRRAQRASGGGVFSVVDAPMHVERIGERRTLIMPDGTKHAPDPAPIIIERQAGDGWIRLVGQTTSGASAGDVALHASIVEHLRQSGGGSQRAIVTAVGRHHRLVGAALKQLQAAGTVDMAEGPRRARLWCLR